MRPSRIKQEELNEKLVMIQNEIDELNKDVDEKNLALYEIRQQSLRNSNKESIFSKDYKPTVLRQAESKQSVRPKDMRVVGKKNYQCGLI